MDLTDDDLQTIRGILTREQRIQFDTRTPGEVDDVIQQYINIFKLKQFPSGNPAIACQIVNALCFQNTAPMTTLEDAQVFFKYWVEARYPVAAVSSEPTELTELVAPVFYDPYEEAPQPSAPPAYNFDDEAPAPSAPPAYSENIPASDFLSIKRNFLSKNFTSQKIDRLSDEMHMLFVDVARGYSGGETVAEIKPILKKLYRRYLNLYTVRPAPDLPEFRERLATISVDLGSRTDLDTRIRYG